MNRFASTILALAAASQHALAGPLGAVHTRQTSSSCGISGAITTTVNTAVDASAESGVTPGSICANGQPSVNCNNYSKKKYVWLTGGNVEKNQLVGPAQQALPDGLYFFAVTTPGGKPLDDDDGNLSFYPDNVPGSSWLVRQVTIQGGQIVEGYAPGLHQVANGKVRLAKYRTTPNNGGEYKAQLCKLPEKTGGGYYTTEDTGVTLQTLGVDPCQCKTDDFKVANDNDDSAPPETCSTQTVDPCTPDLAPAGTCVDANNGECRDMTKSHECSTTGKSDTGACVIVQAGDNPEGSMYCYYPYVAKGTPCGCVPTNPCEMQAVCSGSSATCPEFGGYYSAKDNRVCRPADGVCDAPDFCADNGECGEDIMKGTDYTCAAYSVAIPSFGGKCVDIKCDGINKDCPIPEVKVETAVDMSTKCPAH